MTLKQFKKLAEKHHPQLQEINRRLLKLNRASADGVAGFVVKTARTLGLAVELSNAGGVIIEPFATDPTCNTNCLGLTLRCPSQVSLGLGVASFFASLAGNPPTNFRIIFSNPDNSSMRSAGPVIQESELKDVSHLWGIVPNSSLTNGQLGVKIGPVCSLSEEFFITLFNKAGSADLSHVAAHLVTVLEQLPSRRIDPLKPSEIKISSIQSASRERQVSNSVEIKGSFWTSDESAAQRIPDLIRKSVAGFSEAYQVDFILKNENRSFIVYNEEAAARGLLESGTAVLGTDKIVTLEYPSRISPAFAQLMHWVQTCILEIGTGLPSGNGVAKTEPVELSPDAIKASFTTLCWTFLPHSN